MLQCQVSVIDKKRSFTENKKAVTDECLAEGKETEMSLSLRHRSFSPPEQGQDLLSTKHEFGAEGICCNPVSCQA